MNTQTPKPTDKESKLTLELLQAIDQKDDISQRHLAQQMGVALGLANSYLKRCVKKGLIKMKTAPANRYLYYLTPHGFAEKARLTGEFLSTSLALFRQSGEVYAEVFSDCLAKSSSRVVFAGMSDLTEIAYMRSLQSEIEVVGVFQLEQRATDFFDLPVAFDLNNFGEFDVVVMTSMEQTKDLLEALRLMIDEDRIIVPSLLLNMNYRSEAAHHEAIV
ncbi:MAG: winged helix-turn-helix transcriptional regulator [Gammaproteobacteria bacterium]|nr:winged helix-turn-helix transcriptional regulator [Gammaproteobacteria bacterium]